MGLLDLFRRKPNPLHQLKAAMFKQSLAAAETMKQVLADSGEKMTNERWFAVVMEYQSMYLLVADHFVFGHIEDTKRRVLMDGLVAISIDDSVNALCRGWDAEKIGKLAKECMANYKKACADYGHYPRLFPEKGKGTGETLIWEFSKTIAAMVGHEMDFAYITAATAATNLPALPFKEFVAYAKTL